MYDVAMPIICRDSEERWGGVDGGIDRGVEDGGIDSNV